MSVVMSAASLLLGLTLAGQAESTSSDCGLLPGGEALLDAAAGRALVVGELHGADLPPQFVGSLVCASLARGERVALALELSEPEQTHLDDYFAAEDEREARAHLLTGSRFWSENEDGRSSVAMFELVREARRRMRAGAPLTVHAIDHAREVHGEMEGVSEPRDFVMAENLAELVATGQRVIMLVGNLHAQKVANTDFGQMLQTIGSYSEPDAIYSVRLLSLPGTSWNCSWDGEAMDCGINDTGNDLIDGEPRLLSLETMQASPYWEYYADYYDAFVLLGSPTASLPAAQVLGEEDGSSR